MPRKIVKASELKLVADLRSKVASALAPLAAWETIAEPEVYLESRVGKYVYGLERLLELAIEHNDFEAVRGLTLDLIKMTKLGRAKADINLNSINKLREGQDMTKVDTDALRAILGKRNE
jgi:hypothetical protein